MRHEIKGQVFEIIDEPLQEHVEAWERAARSLKSEDAKPLIREAVTSLENIKMTDDLPTLTGAFGNAAKNLSRALSLLEANEALTMSSNRGMMVKAAISAGWIKDPVMVAADVEKMKPWLVGWLAEIVGRLYLEAVEIPKN